MMTIKDMRWPHRKFNHQAALITLIANRLQPLNVMVKLTMGADGELFFNPIKGGRFVLSKTYNRVMMKETDRRIAVKGRNYLETERLNENQHTKFYETIQGILDELDLEARVVVKDKGETVIREGKTKLQPPKPKSFPVAF